MLLVTGVFAQTSGQDTRSLQPRIEITEIEIYPNPATEWIIVNFKDSQFSNASIELRSMIGNKLPIEIEKMSPTRYRISMKDFASGYYFIVIKDDFLRLNKAYKILKK